MGVVVEFVQLQDRRRGIVLLANLSGDVWEMKFNDYGRCLQRIWALEGGEKCSRVSGAVASTFFQRH